MINHNLIQNISAIKKKTVSHTGFITSWIIKNVISFYLLIMTMFCVDN